MCPYACHERSEFGTRALERLFLMHGGFIAILVVLRGQGHSKPEGTSTAAGLFPASASTFERFKETECQEGCHDGVHPGAIFSK